MPTKNQYNRRIHIRKDRFVTRSVCLLGCPQKRGVVVRTRTMSPKKPNSAKRKIAKVRLPTGRKPNCYIPGMGHTLREFSSVLLRGGRAQDLPGIQYHLMRGLLDFNWQESIIRLNKLSKYGIPPLSKR